MQITIPIKKETAFALVVQWIERGSPKAEI